MACQSVSRAIHSRLLAVGYRSHFLGQKQLPLGVMQSNDFLRAFSSSLRLHNDSNPRSNQRPNQKSNDSDYPEVPAFSLESLGMSKNMRIGVLAIISVFATIETWFWCQWIWRWWKGRGNETDSDN
ncbi:hypothetical protein JX266_011494 [Neoarthrinium moseri]|nr:hypothetical protein JX266_011494 [Neoarthrinium moseri]